MQTGVKNLALAQKWPISQELLFYFVDQIGARKNLLCCMYHLRAGLNVFLARVTGAEAGVFFHEHGMSPASELIRGRRQQRDALFLLFNLLRDADDHFLRSD